MRLSFLMTVALSLGAAPASAQEFVTSNGVDTDTLDTVRGGFAYGESLLVTLGIDRLVRINGNVVEQSTLQFGDVGKVARGAAQVAGNALAGPTLIQNGQASQLAASVGSLGGTIIQNTLNDQLISSQTTIRASVNNAGMVQAMNFGATLNQALNNAVSSK